MLYVSHQLGSKLLSVLTQVLINCHSTLTSVADSRGHNQNECSHLVSHFMKVGIRPLFLFLLLSVPLLLSFSFVLFYLPHFFRLFVSLCICVCEVGVCVYVCVYVQKDGCACVF